MSKYSGQRLRAPSVINLPQYLLQILIILTIIAIAIFFGIHHWNSSQKLEEPIVSEGSSNSHIDKNEPVITVQKDPKIQNKDGLTFLKGMVENVDVRHIRDDYHSSFEEEIVVRVRVGFEVFDLLIDTSKHYASDFNIGDEVEVSGVREGNILHDAEILK